MLRTAYLKKSHSSMSVPRIALTPGEPAGVGPDIVLQVAQQAIPAQLIIFADPEMLAQRAVQLGLKLDHLHIVPISVSQSVSAGQLNVANAPYVLETLRQACQACQNHEVDALVTGPIHKGIINQAGIPFTGHTEFLAQQTKTEHVVMMLATAQLRVALLTTHLPLSQVSSALTATKLEQMIRILHTDLQNKFGFQHPHILVCGLNPHAGEDGHLGQEEQAIIIPVLNALRLEGMHLTGPVAADTAFTPYSLSNVDVVLTMYHDQGLPVLKSQGFGESVNITLGLPIIRTSVDHGTALKLAGTGCALSSSLHAAIQMALTMVHSRFSPLTQV